MGPIIFTNERESRRRYSGTELYGMKTIIGKVMDQGQVELTMYHYIPFVRHVIICGSVGHVQYVSIKRE